MKTSVTNWVQSARIDISDEQVKRLSEGEAPDEVLDENQWRQIRIKIPRTPAVDLVFREVDEITDRPSYNLIWSSDMNRMPSYRRNHFAE